jgi:SLT domain-containing protein
MRHDAETIRGWITEATEITGVGDEWVEPLAALAMKESLGDPEAHGPLGGEGLFCLSPAVFAFHGAAGDIHNPVHNAAAVIRYIQHRYGSIEAVADRLAAVPPNY